MIGCRVACVVVLARGRAALLSLRSRCAAAGTPILYSGVVVYTVSQRFFVGALICAIQLRYLFTIREIDSYLAITDALANIRRIQSSVSDLPGLVPKRNHNPVRPKSQIRDHPEKKWKERWGVGG